MKSLVIFDSTYGNTKDIAKAIGQGISSDVEVLNIDRASITNLRDLDLLVIGSPTHGGMPTEKLIHFIDNLPKDLLKDVKIAAFDTRFETDTHGMGLRILMNVIRFAADKTAKKLIRIGGVQIIQPEGFIVEDKKGPLKNGELERAKKWGSQLAYAIKGTASDTSS